MKEVFGSPGKVSGLVLRIGQCSFAAASIGVMVSAHGFFNSTAFWYIICPSYQLFFIVQFHKNFHGFFFSGFHLSSFFLGVWGERVIYSVLT